jgi:FkbM family methyltransferase
VTSTSDLDLDCLDVDFMDGTRNFVYRHDSVGDRGVIQQIFHNDDYRLGRFGLHGAFMLHLKSIRDSGRRPLIIDAGANIGASPIYFLSQYPGAVVVAVEPERNNCRLLRANCEGLDVRLIEAALCGQPGPRFLSDPGLSDWGFRVSDQGLYEVRDYPIDTYAPVILKIDIEGGEKDLFSGDVSWLAVMPIVIIELHDWMLPGEAIARNFLRAISALDFDFIHVGENTFCFNNTLLSSGTPKLAIVESRD